ncbi:hypothetical protein UPYG_G00246220 [Umbra pygmaea]|uniref:Caspase-3 n=1 Tax=Umbra pygmaea TaxID=75934 RepID=A0ABD0WLC0_UMBPY
MSSSDNKCSPKDTVDAKGFSAPGPGSPSKPQLNKEDNKIDDKPPADMYKYNMNYPNIGQCVIINNKKFHHSTGMSFRHGSDVDEMNAKKVFSKLGYKVNVFKDQKVNQIEDLLQNVSQEDHSQSASFVCVLLSHGDDGVIYGTDDTVELNKLTGYFRGNCCKTLVGKPKLFFVQACRGKDLDDGIETDSRAVVDDETTEKIPVEADFLYAYSTVPGFYSWRNPEKGSWFMQAIYEMFQQYGNELDIMRIMTRVNHKVAHDFESLSATPGFLGKKQIPCIVSMLTKDLYFSS